MSKGLLSDVDLMMPDPGFSARMQVFCDPTKNSDF
ncbi:hypothetical protein TH47_11950 [Thalassospira sp. MCCC 1A02803]|nr:hypothetical protein TH47_11950 [Thalassospira sp. MCCC 1A02803]